jgi:hypothetical protein
VLEVLAVTVVEEMVAQAQVEVVHLHQELMVLAVAVEVFINKLHSVVAQV